MEHLQMFLLYQWVKYGTWGGFRPSHIIQCRNLCAVCVMCSICHCHNILPTVFCLPWQSLFWGNLWQRCASRWACVVMFVFIFHRYLLREKPAKRSHSHYLRYVLTVCMWRNILSDIEYLVMVITFVAFVSWQSSSLILSLCLVALFSLCVLLL